MSQRTQGQSKRFGVGTVVDRIVLLGLAELAALFVDNQGQVHPAGRLPVQAMIDVGLPGSGLQQVRTPYHLGNARVMVIDDNSKLVGDETVGTPDDEVAGTGAGVLVYFALNEIMKNDGVGAVGSQTNTAG